MSKTREELISAAIDKFGSKENKLYFFVVDTKGAPNGSVEYMYDIALYLKEAGYDVKMIYQEKEFEGPFAWLGDKYKELSHYSIESKQLTFSPADFLFIPEIYTNIMAQVKELPCQKVMLYYNPEYFLEFVPVGSTLDTLKINTVITTNETMEKRIKSFFPGIRTYIVRPAVKGFFYDTEEPKKLIINVVAAQPIDAAKVVKPFYWKYPIYKWVSFRDLRGVTQELFAEALRESAITIWIDDKTMNAQDAIEAKKSGSILIAKVPDEIPSWMMDGDDLRSDIIWFYSFDNLYDIIASVIRGWTRGDIVESFMTPSVNDENMMSKQFQNNDIDRFIVNGIISHREEELKALLSMINKKEE